MPIDVYRNDDIYNLLESSMCYNPSFTVVMLKSPKSIITSVKFSYS